MDRSKQLLDGNRFKVATVIFASFLLLGAMVFSFSSVSADENGERKEVEVPEWREGYSWTYRLREPVPVEEGTYMISDIEREVVDTDARFSIGIDDNGDESFDTYRVDERWVVDQEEEDETEEIDTILPGINFPGLTPIQQKVG